MSEGQAVSCVEADACIPVKGNWLAQVTSGDNIEFTDARGKLRSIQIVGRAGFGCWGEFFQTAYVKPGLQLDLLGAPGSGALREYTMPEDRGYHGGNRPVLSWRQPHYNA
jgi:pyruvate kinase